MFNTIHNWFNNPENLTFTIIIKMMKSNGMWFLGRSKFKTLIFILNVLFLVIYMLSIWMFMVFKFSYYAFIVFMQLSALQFGVYKILKFSKDHAAWENLLENFHEIERQLIKDATPAQYALLVTYRKYCNAVIAIMLLAFLFVNIPFVLFFIVTKLLLADFSKPLKITENLYNVLIPIDVTTRNGRYVSGFLQVLFTEISAMYLLSWDMMVLMGLMFYVGQIKSINLRFIHLFDNAEEDVCLQSIVQCHQHYIQLIKYQKVFNKLVSPVMFAYLILITINYGVCVIFLVMQKDNLLELIPTFVLVVGLSFELIMFYWIGNEVIFESAKMSYGIFECKWVPVNARVHRALLLLGVGIRQRMAFTAGPFHEVSMSTFISILRTSYSFYTLLSSKT